MRWVLAVRKLFQKRLSGASGVHRVGIGTAIAIGSGMYRTNNLENVTIDITGFSSAYPFSLYF